MITLIAVLLLLSPFVVAAATLWLLVRAYRIERKMIERRNQAWFDRMIREKLARR